MRSTTPPEREGVGRRTIEANGVAVTLGVTHSTVTGTPSASGTSKAHDECTSPVSTTVGPAAATASRTRARSTG